MYRVTPIHYPSAVGFVAQQGKGLYKHLTFKIIFGWGSGGCDKRMLIEIDIARGSYVFELMMSIVDEAEDEDHLYSYLPFKQKMRQKECIVDKANGEDFIFSTTKGVLS